MTLNPFRLMHRSIASRLLLLTILPLVLVTVIMTAYTIRSRQVEVEDSLYSIGRSTVDYLAMISDFALYSGNRNLLQSLATSANRIAHVHSVAFLGPGRDLLASTPEFNAAITASSTPEYRSADGELLYFERPVLAGSMEVSDFFEAGITAGERPATIGWIIVAIDRSISISKGRDIIVSNLLIGLSILAVTAIIAFYLAKTVVTPLKQITRAVRAMQRGELQTQITPTTEDELAELAEGINHLARSVAAGREDLERKVENATLRLSQTLEDMRSKNRELERARSEAEAASRAKGDFLAQMSHELRTPITAIQGFIRLLSESGLDSNEKRYCTIIDQAARQLLLLIDDILSITRLQSRNLSLESTPVNVIDCLENPISMMAPGAHQKGLELILDIAPDVPLIIQGDSLRIRQIVFNLVSNAIKFTDEGHVLVRVQQLSGHGTLCQLAIQIQDTGIGIPERVRRQVFEPFAQGDNSISRRYGGSGLGLAIVKNLVGLMGGSIKVDSKMGRGTRFDVLLPLDNPVSGIPSANTGNFPGQVLLYDPNPWSRQALEHLLARHVDKLESCENLAEIEFLPGDVSPELVVYSAPVNQTIEHSLAVLRSLRGMTKAQIIVVAPLENPGNSIDRDTLAELQPIGFIAKPPTLAEFNLALAGSAGIVSSTASAAANLNDLSVLVAEDNAFNSLLLETLLGKAGARVQMAADGARALQLSRGEAFDLVLLDVHMPEKNGIEVVREIRADGGVNQHTPVVMLTADVLQQEEADLFAAGATELLFKPLNEKRLFACIQKLTGEPLSANAELSTAVTELPREIFLGEIRKLADAATVADKNSNQEALRDNIHQLLGIAGIYRMHDLERAVQQVHIALRKGNEQIIAAALESLHLEVSLLEAAQAAGTGT